MTDLSMRLEHSRPGWFTSEDIQDPMSNRVRWRIASRPHIWRPPTDVYETEEAVIVRVEIAGMRENDFSISLVDRNLTIHGVRPDTTEKRAYHQMEIPFGEFSTEIDIPFPIVTDEVEATYRDGFLKVVLPKARPHHIKVGN